MNKYANKYRGLLNVRHTTAGDLLRAIRAKFLPGPSSELLPIIGRRRVYAPGARAYGHGGARSSDVKLLFTKKWTRPGGNIVSYADNGWTAGSQSFLRRLGYNDADVAALEDSLRNTVKDAVLRGHGMSSHVVEGAMRAALQKRGISPDEIEQRVLHMRRLRFDKGRAFAFLKAERKRRAGMLYDALLHRGERMQMDDLGTVIGFLDRDVSAAGRRAISAPGSRSALGPGESLYKRLRSVYTSGPYWENKVYGEMPFSRDAISAVLLRDSIDKSTLTHIRRLLDAKGIPHRTYSGDTWLRQAMLAGERTP